LNLWASGDVSHTSPFFLGVSNNLLVLHNRFGRLTYIWAQKVINRLFVLNRMAKPAPISKKELKTSVIIIALIVGAFILSTLVLVTQYWFALPIFVVCLLLAVGYFTASKHLYQCPSCSKKFKITAVQDFFAPHGITKGPNNQLYEWKLLKCAEGSKRGKCYRVQDQK
jgi:riboflavin transporter FmnP